MVAMVHVSIVCTNLPKSLKSLKSQMKMVLNMILLALANFLLTMIGTIIFARQRRLIYIYVACNLLSIKHRGHHLPSRLHSAGFKKNSSRAKQSTELLPSTARQCCVLCTYLQQATPINSNDCVVVSSVCRHTSKSVMYRDL